MWRSPSLGRGHPEGSQSCKWISAQMAVHKWYQNLFNTFSEEYECNRKPKWLKRDACVRLSHHVTKMMERRRNVERQPSSLHITSFCSLSFKSSTTCLILSSSHGVHFKFLLRSGQLLAVMHCSVVLSPAVVDGWMD